jgi:hyperosmotically inducible protein
MNQLIKTSALALTLASSASCMADKTAGDVVDDSWIHTKVKTALVGHGSSDINVEVFHGVVQLAGFMASGSTKANAVKAAAGIEGVAKVSDQIHVVEGKRSAGTVLDDNTLTGKVKAALVDAGHAGINVEVNRGNVLLSGFVDSDVVRNKAVDLIKGVTGVASVINGMDVKA